MTRRTVVSAAIASAVVLAGAAPIAGQMVMPGASTPQNAVAISDVGYTPSTMVVAPGQHVTWTNGGAAIHTVTADTGQFDSGNMAPKAKYDLMAPATAGSIPYHCTYHAYMVGTLVVSNLSLKGPKTVTGGKPAALSGAAPGTAAGTAIVVEKFASGAWTQVASTTVAADTTFRVAIPKLTGLTTLRANIGETLSPSVAVAVMPRITAKKAGELSLAVTVTPAKAGKAKLERRNPKTKRWATVRHVSIGSRGTATVKAPKAGTFRVTLPATKTLLGASSPSVTLR